MGASGRVCFCARGSRETSSAVSEETGAAAENPATVSAEAGGSAAPVFVSASFSALGLALPPAAPALAHSGGGPGGSGGCAGRRTRGRGRSRRGPSRRSVERRPPRPVVAAILSPRVPLRVVILAVISVVPAAAESVSVSESLSISVSVPGTLPATASVRPPAILPSLGRRRAIPPPAAIAPVTVHAIAGISHPRAAIVPGTTSGIVPVSIAISVPVAAAVSVVAVSVAVPISIACVVLGRSRTTHARVSRSVVARGDAVSQITEIGEGVVPRGSGSRGPRSRGRGNALVVVVRGGWAAAPRGSAVGSMHQRAVHGVGRGPADAGAADVPCVRSLRHERHVGVLAVVLAALAREVDRFRGGDAPQGDHASNAVAAGSASVGKRGFGSGRVGRGILRDTG